MMIKQVMGAVVLLASGLVVAEEAAPVQWEQIGFTATEVLIYTDQLQKLDATPCNPAPVSAYSTATTRTELLALMPAAERERLATLLDSPMVQSLLEENSKGIQAMLGAQKLTDGRLGAADQATCLELSLAFAENQRQAREELEQLVARYQAQ